MRRGVQRGIEGIDETVAVSQFQCGVVIAESVATEDVVPHGHDVRHSDDQCTEGYGNEERRKWSSQQRSWPDPALHGHPVLSSCG